MDSAVSGGIAISHDGKYIYVAETINNSPGICGNADIAVITSGSSPRLVKRIALTNTNAGLSGSPFTQIAISPDDTTLYVTTAQNCGDSLYAINVATSAVTRIIYHAGYGQGWRSVVVSPNGLHAVMSEKNGGANNQGALIVINTNTNTIATTIDNASLREFCIK